MNCKQAAALLQERDNILILTHKRPDGDTVGCAVGLCHALRKFLRKPRGKSDSRRNHRNQRKNLHLLYAGSLPAGLRMQSRLDRNGSDQRRLRRPGKRSDHSGSLGAPPDSFRGKAPRVYPHGYGGFLSIAGSIPYGGSYL